MCNKTNQLLESEMRAHRRCDDRSFHQLTQFFIQQSEIEHVHPNMKNGYAIVLFVLSQLAGSGGWMTAAAKLTYSFAESPS